MVGQAPFDQTQEGDQQGRTTWINAPVVAVSMDLRNADNTPRFVKIVNGNVVTCTNPDPSCKRLFYDGTQYVAPVLASPVFSKTFYGSSDEPTQFTDAIQRAEFFEQADNDWHTLLRPAVKTPRTMVLIRGTYRFALNSDGSCCAFILVDDQVFANALFPAVPTDTSTVIGAAENSGDVHTRDISTFLFPNTYLYTEHNPSHCCILGYHTYDLEPGDARNGWRERRYVVNYSSWISPGLFGPTFTDVTALSHELAETFNDPFVNNATPWWLAPNTNCQNNLETGDVIEGLPNATYAISLHGFTWHPQNEALLEWFAGQAPSSAIQGAYSYPDTTVLASEAISQNLACTPPIP